MKVGLTNNTDQPAVELGPAEIEILALPAASPSTSPGPTATNHIGVPLTLEHARRIALSLEDAADNAEDVDEADEVTPLSEAWRMLARTSATGGDGMYARIATFEGDPANVDEAISSVKGQVEGGSPPPGLENAKGMMMLINRENGKGMGLTLFENEDDLKRGDAALNNMNPSGGGRRTSVEFYEVAVQRM